MSDVTGPITTLPGSSREVPEGTMCDHHDDRPAVRRLQGETDSFGSEMHDLCQECVDEHRAYARSAEARTGQCDWCKQRATDLRNCRDFEEGMSGPVYLVCGACVKRENDRIREEEAEREDDYDWDDDRDEDDECTTCRGSGIVNPLTAPKGVLCVGAMDCPHCEGSGVVR